MESDCSGRYDRKRLAKHIVRQTINMSYMLSIETYVRTSPEIGACLRLRHRELFKVPWFVAWFRGLEELLRMVGLNREDIKERIQKFLLAISDLLLMFGFAGYYCVKDMDLWTEAQQRMAERTGTTTSHISKLPFGIIPLRASVSGGGGGGGGCQDNMSGVMYGTYALYTNSHTMEESLCYDCLEPAISRLYEFHVISRDAIFVSLSDGTKVVTGGYTNNNNYYNSGTNDLVPSTVFSALYIKRSLIEEASDDQFDANWTLSHPQTFLTAKLMPDAKLNTLSETTYYAADSITNATQVDNIKKQVAAMQNVRALIEKMNGARYSGCSGGNGQRQVTRPEDLLRAQRKRKYQRPDVTEGMHAVPEYVDVSMGHAPSVIVDVDALQRQYVHECCSAVRVPYIYYAAEAGGGGSSSRRNRNRSGGGGGSSGIHEDEVEFFREQFDEEIAGERRMLSRLFGRIYTQTYLSMDVKGIYMAMTRQMDGDDDTEEQKQYARVRGAVERGALHVGLKFEETRIHNTDALLPLLQCMEKGVVGVDYVQRYVYALYGEPEPARVLAIEDNNNNMIEDDDVNTADLPV